MKSLNLKNIALVSMMALGLGALSTLAIAAPPPPQEITATVITESVIDVVHVEDMDFLEWLIIVRSTDAPTITMLGDGSMSAGATGTSTLQNLTGGNGTPAELTVDLPDGSENTILQMSHDADFPQALTGTTVGALELTALSYTSTGYNNVNFPEATAVDVNVVEGITAQNVKLGATLTAQDTPADGPYTTTFNVSFAY